MIDIDLTGLEYMVEDHVALEDFIKDKNLSFKYLTLNHDLYPNEIADLKLKSLADQNRINLQGQESTIQKYCHN